MAVGTTLLVSIGTSISKRLISLYMGNGTIESELAGDFSDYFMKKAADANEARNATGAFAELGKKIAQDLVPLLEDGSVDEGGAEAVAQAVSETVGDASIRVMIDARMDPDAIAALLINNSVHRTAHFTADEDSLYQRCIRTCVIRMTGMVAKSPDFVGAALSEVLRHLGALLDQVSEIRESTTQSAHHLPAAPSNDDDAFEDQYRRAIVDNLDRVDLFGLDLHGPANRRQKLSLAYTGLSSSYRVKSGPDEEDDIVPIEQLVGRSKHLLVRGQPGSGKTTLLKWIAIMAAQRTLSVATADPMSAIPFYIPFRQCSSGPLPGPEDFVTFVARSLAGAMPHRWVHDCLASGRGIVLIDSVDEIPRARRGKARDWLDDLMRTYPRNQFVITSRPYALSDAWETSEAFTSTELQPMEVADIYDFIDRWHRAVENEMQDKGEIEELDAIGKKLKIEIDRNLALRHIATNPLLCAALCALNRDRHQKLPTDRIEIYEAFCAMLLDRRDREQDLDVERADYPSLTARQKRALLEDLSYHMLKNARVSIDTADVLERLKTKLPSIPNLDSSADDVLRLFVERSGIIREAVMGEVDFTHRTLQEYLGAHASINENDINVLLEHAGDDRWREVIILAAGIARGKRTGSIVSGLLAQGDRDPSLRHQRHLLAVACLDTTVELDPKIQGRVTQSLAALIPPATFDDARIISSARDAAVPYLRYDPHHTVAQAAACVRALLLIATNDAMDAIKTYGSDTRPQVLREVIRGAESFPTWTYFAEVLRHFTIDALDLKSVKSLKGIESLGGLESLSLTLMENIADASPLAHLTKLKKLAIRGDGRALSDLHFLSTLKDLRVLTLDSPIGPSSLEAIQHLSGLEQLSIRDCAHIKDYSPLRDVPNLRVLELEGCDHLPDLSCFDALHHMERLTVRGLGKARDLTPLSRLHGLLHLELVGLDRVFNLSPLKHLTQLRTVILGGFRRDLDLTPLADIAHLVRLRIDGVAGITGLQSLVSLLDLESLEMVCAGGQRVDFTPIQDLVGLRTLQLHGFPNQDDLSFLMNHQHLKAVSLSGFDHVDDVGVLGELRTIESLYLASFKELQDASPLRALSGLRVKVAIPPALSVGASPSLDGWGTPVRGGLKPIGLDVAKRHAFGVYSLDFAVSRHLLTRGPKIIEARQARPSS